MELGQISFRFLSAAMPAIGISSGVVASLLVASGLVLRWKTISSFIRRVVFCRPKYDYRRIFQEYLDRFNAITDRRELYPAILSATCRILDVDGASLIVRDAKGDFQMKASHGLRAFSFDVNKVRPFLDWLDRHRDMVTRHRLVHSKALVDIKSDGLCYFVQFNAEACVPLYVNDRLYGVINLGARREGVYDSETRDLLKLLAVQFAIAIHNVNLYQALLSQNFRLQEASRFKTQLMANLSHELRTPLSSIIGLSELMAEGGDGEVNGEQMNHLLLIRQAGARLLDTVSAMLDLSRLEVNRLDLDVQKVNVGRLITQIVKTLPLGKYTKLEIKLGDKTPGVYGDEKRLSQVLRHLLDNAVKFTPRGKISVDAEKCGEMLKICVKDTGVGISPDMQEIIFEGFRQVDGTMTRKYDGLGLGLTISRKLVELHGGRMWLKSKVGRGSEFHFTLPLKPIGVFGNGESRS